MQVTTEKVGAKRGFKVVSTPGALAVMCDEIGARFAAQALVRLGGPGAEPSWVTCGPVEETDDGGRTLRLASPAGLWAIRDDHESDCDCGCGGRSVVTILRPDEY